MRCGDRPFIVGQGLEDGPHFAPRERATPGQHLAPHRLRVAGALVLVGAQQLEAPALAEDAAQRREVGAGGAHLVAL